MTAADPQRARRAAVSLGPGLAPLLGMLLLGCSTATVRAPAPPTPRPVPPPAPAAPPPAPQSSQPPPPAPEPGATRQTDPTKQSGTTDDAAKPSDAQTDATKQAGATEPPDKSAAPTDDPYFALERCPPEMTLLPGNVCIDRWEASLVQLLRDGTPRRWSPFKKPRGRLRAVSRPGVVPQGYINGRQAAAACEASGKRLCRVSEWEHACRGPANTTFPYGAARRKGVCNDDGRAKHPVSEAGSRLGWTLDRMWREGMDHPLINQLANTVEKTGQHAECTNDYGVFDMVGNLHEWIADPDGTFRGGYFMDTTINGDGCEYATTAHSTGYHDYSIGFRCCKDAQDN